MPVQEVWDAKRLLLLLQLVPLPEEIASSHERGMEKQCQRDAGQIQDDLV